MEIKNLLVKLANHLDTLGLFEESDVLDAILAESIESPIIKSACIIASGNFGNKKCLFKNRDRNYLPKIRIHHTIIDGVEVVYMNDEVTEWTEGMNEFGIGIVNSALAVAADEREGKRKIIKDDKDEKGDKEFKNKKRKKYFKNEKRMLLALSKRDVESAVKVIDENLGGLTGHNIIADPKRTIAMESTKEDDVAKIVELNESKMHIRSNHGFYFPKAGYGPSDGASYYSSHSRLQQAKDALKNVKSPENIAPAIYKKRFKHLDDPMNMVRDTDNMKTTSQVVFNLSDLEFNFYIVPGKVKFMGYDKDLPNGYEPKIKVNIFKFTKLDESGDFETKKLKSGTH